MKKIAALAVVLGAGMAANAQEVVNVGTFNLVPGQPLVINFPATGSNYDSMIFAGTYIDLADPFAFATDLKVEVQSPGGQFYSVGGFDDVINAWPTMGTGAGTYSETVAFGWSEPMTGPWTFTLINDFTSNVGLDWENVSITLVPAPGAAALMGMGGLLAFRRRR